MLKGQRAGVHAIEYIEILLMSVNFGQSHKPLNKEIDRKLIQRQFCWRHIYSLPDEQHNCQYGFRNY